MTFEKREQIDTELRIAIDTMKDQYDDDWLAKIASYANCLNDMRLFEDHCTLREWKEKYAEIDHVWKSQLVAIFESENVPEP